MISDLELHRKNQEFLEKQLFSQLPQVEGVEDISDQQRKNAELTQQVNSSVEEKLKHIAHEAKRLQRIKQELNKLDQSVSKSVDILRVEIEAVGREVHLAQKDFDRAEAMFMAQRERLAKLKQRKVLLTGHLDFIILSNEREKDAKLRELQQTLDAPAVVATITNSTNGTTQVQTTQPTTTFQPAPEWTGFSPEEVDKFQL